VYAHVELLVGDVLDGFVLWLGNEVDRRLVLVLAEMAIDTVITGVDSASDEPFPERRIARVERDVPGPVPVEKIGVLFETVREVAETESFKDRLVGQVGLNNEFLWRVNVVLFLPVDRDLSLRRFCGSILRHTLPPRATSRRGRPPGANFLIKPTEVVSSVLGLRRDDCFAEALTTLLERLSGGVRCHGLHDLTAKRALAGARNVAAAASATSSVSLQ